ncbi:MAG: lysine biosynthesis protein LysX [Candidatus Roizmanbacteria bacterium]|nr:lysine biosynthesis protein LysX [Candidatus Roizmanbacteria bacterium]
MITIGLLHSTIRGDEKLILEAAKKRNVTVKLIDIRRSIYCEENPLNHIDVALERSVSTVKGMYAAYYYESKNIPVVNSTAVAAICEDKFLTSLALMKARVPTIPFGMAFSVVELESLIASIGGYPVVIKPPEGSWGRLLAKINDKDALEAVIEHKDVLGTPSHKAFYVQKYIQKKQGRDIRAFVIDGHTICAIYRHSPHWITNTARGGVASNCTVDSELATICKNASIAVDGGILAMDVVETKDGYIINEINHTMEFKNSEMPTKTSISGYIVDYCLQIAQTQ